MGRIDRRVSIDITLYREQVERTPGSSFSLCISQPNQCNSAICIFIGIPSSQAREPDCTPYPNDSALLPVSINTASGLTSRPCIPHVRIKTLTGVHCQKNDEK